MTSNKQIRYEINVVKRTIMAMEKKGRDASYERGLLKSWAKYPGWEYAKEALGKCGGNK